MHGLICVPIATLTKEPSKRSLIEDEVLYGTLVDIVRETLNFYFIRTSYNYMGYIKKEEIRVIKTTIDHFHLFNGMINKHYVDILTEPKYQSKTIISLPKGSTVKIVNDVLINGFLEVELVNHQRGFVHNKSIKYRKKSDLGEEHLRERIVQNALSFINTQYRWGGKTILGMDCSGLCSLSYLLEEIVIHRDANFNHETNQQIGLKKINKEELKPADLIYAKGHMMMYLGNDKYLHSSGSLNGVVINSLNPSDQDFSETHFKDIYYYATIF